MSLLDTVLDNLNRQAAKSGLPPIKPGKIEPQKRHTSYKLSFLKAVPVRVKIPLNLPVRYTKAGSPAKRQPAPLKPGDAAYVKLNALGHVNIVPFAMAGSGYELVEDAEEGVHYEFDIEAILNQSDDPMSQLSESKRFR